MAWNKRNLRHECEDEIAQLSGVPDVWSEDSPEGGYCKQAQRPRSPEEKARAIVDAFGGGSR